MGQDLAKITPVVDPDTGMRTKTVCNEDQGM